MTERVENEIRWEDRLALAVHLGSALGPVKVIDAGAQLGLAVPVGENKQQGGSVPSLRLAAKLYPRSK